MGSRRLAGGILRWVTRQGNQALVRQAVDALNQGDLAAFKACLHPDVEWEENDDAFPGLQGDYRGPAQVEKWAEQAARELWKDLHMEVQELTETNDGRVLLGILITARGTASGVETEQRAWQLFSFADDMIAKRQGPFWTREKALEVAGLSA
jgi:ketosteroid isomerase-like protein